MCNIAMIRICEIDIMFIKCLSDDICRMILAGEVGLLVVREGCCLCLAREMGVTYVCLR